MKKITTGTFDCHPEDVKAVVKAIESGFISVGKELRAFEAGVALDCNKAFGIMTNSGQAALEAAIEYAKQKIGKKTLRIGCPATTYAASLWAIVRTNCEPVFYDIDNSYVLDYSQIKPEDDLDAILAVDLCGKTAEPPFDIWDNNYIIEDACEAFGNKNCDYGDIVCFSFYVSHMITTGSGGMLCVQDEEAETWIKSFIAHGRAFGGDFTQFKDKWVNRFLFDKVGVSCRSDNISAALGYSQFKRTQSVIKKRKENALSLIKLYEKNERLKQHFIFPSIDYHKDCVFQFFPILIREASLNREHLLNHLFEKGIDSRVLLSLTNQPAFIDLYGDIAKQYPFADYCNNNGFIIGCHQGLDLSDIEYTINIMADYVDSKRRL